MEHLKQLCAGLTLVCALTIFSVASAQGTTTPTAPNTGEGGNATTNVMLLGASGLLAVVGVTYLVRHRREVTEK